MVHQLNAETDTIIEYVSLYRDQRGALARKDKERKEELERLAKQRNEVQGRVDELELLLKSTVQSIKSGTKPTLPPDTEETDQTPDGETEENPDSEEFEVVENTEQSKNIDKILTLLDEIRDPFNGQTIPAMIGVEYQGPLHVI